MLENGFRAFVISRRAFQITVGSYFLGHFGTFVLRHFADVSLSQIRLCADQNDGPLLLRVAPGLWQPELVGAAERPSVAHRETDDEHVAFSVGVRSNSLVDLL